MNSKTMDKSIDFIDKIENIFLNFFLMLPFLYMVFAIGLMVTNDPTGIRTAERVQSSANYPKIMSDYEFRKKIIAELNAEWKDFEIHDGMFLWITFKNDEKELLNFKTGDKMLRKICSISEKIH